MPARTVKLTTELYPSRSITRPSMRLPTLKREPRSTMSSSTDIRKVVKIAHSAGALTIADNTFATPFNQRPIELGVDLVIHSGTKYMGGHSDLTAGLLVGSAERLKHIRSVATKLFGGTIAPQ